MAGNFKIEFTLKQHTPLIHFQHDQAGATLRATELKPKLDKFLKKQIPTFKGDLDYKIKITFENKNPSTNPNRFLYFSQEHRMITFTGLKVIITSFDLEILKKIKELFGDFLLITNFGTRSSKGYGSFSLDNQNNIDAILKKHYSNVYKLSFSVNNDNWESKIDNFHKRIKAGINFGGYQKSLLFKYMCNSKNIRWEKRKIKQQFPILAVGRSPIDCEIIDENKFRYIRAMLGLAEINEYNRGNDQVKIKHQTADKKQKIERFQTPILYKVINQSVYLLPDDSYKTIMEKTFEFSYNGKAFDIDTPSQTEFDLIAFLNFVETNGLIRRV
ncbi:MAG: hypothetical protein HQK72_02860 [Desulfamplus sp.]|nr:hypothetical protein [Desulfamplus sp.]